MRERTTPEHITNLNEGEIFVFGSNESGRHGKFAARTAMKWGAKYGQAEGLQGRTYGIPTVNASISNKLSIDKISKYIDRFIVFARENPQLTFLVTKVGCGSAGHDIKDIARRFYKAYKVKNIYLPKEFWRVLDRL